MSRSGVVPLASTLVCLSMLSDVAQAQPAPDPLRSAWRLAVEEFSGNPHALATDGRSLFFDDFQSFVEVSLTTGRRTRRFQKHDEKGCEDETVYLQADRQSARLFALTVCNPREEEMARTLPGPRVEQASLRAFSLQSGKLSWMAEGRIPAPVDLAAERLYLVCDGELRALDGGSGQELWKAAVPDEVAVGPAASAEAVFVISEAGTARAFAARDGKPLWTQELSGRARCAPVVTADGVIISRLVDRDELSSGSAVSCLSAEDGRVLWNLELPGELAFHRPVVVGERVFLVSAGDEGPGAVRALEAGSGREMWKQPVVCDDDCEPVLDEGRLLVWSADLEEFAKTGVSEHYSLWLLDEKTGAVRGRHPLRLPEKFALSRPVAAKGRVAFSIGDEVRGLSLRWPASRSRAVAPR
ncbi:MAG: PQQ-binding-like beta-propeller repeat protein [Myxococcales bacterium]|nr:PQQ-binding-like beta-propeller repeat protein [Myxococcales bacterium]